MQNLSLACCAQLVLDGRSFTYLCTLHSIQASLVLGAEQNGIRMTGAKSALCCFPRQVAMGGTMDSKDQAEGFQLLSHPHYVVETYKSCVFDGHSPLVQQVL